MKGGVNLYIYKLKIENFRCFENLVWKPNKDKNVLIGANGSGKTTIATAIDYVLNPYLQWYKRKLPITDYYDANTEREIKIEVWFKDIDDFIFDENDLLLQTVNDDVIDDNGNEFVLIMRFTAGEDQIGKHSIVSNGQEHRLSQKQKDSIGFHLVDSERKPEDELSFGFNSLLSKKIDSSSFEESISKIIKKNKEYTQKELSKNTQFSELLDNMAKTFYEYNLVKSLDKSIEVEPHDLSERKTMQTLSLIINGNGTSIPLKQQSKGRKNALLLLLLADSIDDKNILFIEEPEQNLEPQLQRKVAKKLFDSINGQLFIATHSSDIVKRFNYSEIFLVNNNEVKKIPDSLEISKSFSKKSEKYEKADLIDGLFSDVVLLVEGTSEYGAYPVFSEYSKYSFEQLGLKLIFTEGKSNLQYYAKFYGLCNKRVICLLDNDTDIISEINKICDANPEAIIVLQKEDYEKSLLEMDIFNEVYKDLFNLLVPFSEYKDNYFKPFSQEQLENKEFDKKEIKSIEDIVTRLDEDKISEYQSKFLHSNFTSIVDSKKVAIFLAEKSIEKGYLSVPTSFNQLTMIINSIIGNSNFCPNTECGLISMAKEACCECFIKLDKYYQLKGV